MIQGIVNGRLEVTVLLTLRTPTGADLALTAIVDTGYNGSLALPEALAESLGLPQRPPARVKLGDGSRKLIRFYSGEILWQEQVFRVPILATQDECIIGTALLNELRLEVTFRTGETVSIFSP